MLSKSLLLASLLSLAPSGLSAAIEKRSVSDAVITDNFPDPALIEVDGVWYAFATNGLGKKIPTASSSDFNSWSILDSDALPTVGAWSNGANVWAPDVIRRPDGIFVMYYSANNADGSSHCIGAATSESVTGPYNPEANSIACFAEKGGSIDPAGFVDSDGAIYVVWKIDGNNMGHGGNCNNGVEPIEPTPIMMQKMAADGVNTDGDAFQILDRDDADGPLIEAPSLVKSADGTYVLFFSSNCYAGGEYDISYATATSVGGPYTKVQDPDAPLLVTGDSGLYSPGGADVSPDGTKLVFHADLGTTADTRQMYTAEITISGGVVTI